MLFVGSNVRAAALIRLTPMYQAVIRPARTREIVDPGPDQRECRLVVVRLTWLDDRDVDRPRPWRFKLAATVMPAVPPPMMMAET